MGHDAAYELMSDKPSRWHEQEETGDAPTEKGLGPIQGRGGEMGPPRRRDSVEVMGTAEKG